MLERIRNNGGLKLLALALALVMWAYLRFAANPAIAAHFDQQLSVPIVITGLASDKVARFSERQTVVTIAMPRDGTAPVRPDDMRAVLNLSGKGAGVYAVPVVVVAPHLEIRSISPENITLSIEQIESRSVAAQIRYVGEARAGIVTAQPSVTPARVLVRGASDDLAHLHAIHVDLAFPPGPANVDAMIRPVAVDADGTELRGVTISPNLVRVRTTFVAASSGR